MSCFIEWRDIGASFDISHRRSRQLNLSLSMVQNEEDIFAVLVVAQADSFSDRCGIASIELTDKFDGRRSERELLVRNLCFTPLVRRACAFPILWGV